MLLISPVFSSIVQVVSILTRTEVRVLLFHLQPHQLLQAVSILTRTEVRVLRLPAHRTDIRLLCFNPHPHRGAGAASDAFRSVTRSAWVSILTRTEVRVLRPTTPTSWPCWTVSILTRTEVRVLHRGHSVNKEFTQFQSSPAPRCGCCRYLDAEKNGNVKFQSSPAPRCGCCHRAREMELPLQRFNPHPHRGAGAASQRGQHDSFSIVSILTRTEVRVLRGEYPA